MADTITSVITQEVITSVDDVNTITEADESEIIYSKDTESITYSDIITDHTAKSSADDAGMQGQMAHNDDYVYVCTTTGTAGNAIWKRIPLLRT